MGTRYIVYKLQLKINGVKSKFAENKPFLAYVENLALNGVRFFKKICATDIFTENTNQNQNLVQIPKVTQTHSLSLDVDHHF